MPDVTGLPLLLAALAYAACGWYVIPTDPRDIKNPGSVLGSAWQRKSTRDPEQIRMWWLDNPDCGIALHCGKSGAVVFDFDEHSLGQVARDGRPDIARALRRAAAIQHTRRKGHRGHYVYSSRRAARYGNGAGAFRRWGEVRGRNGVIIAAPTPHADGGRYEWFRVGEVTPIPRVLRACLSDAGSPDDLDPITDAELNDFLAAHEDCDNTAKLGAVLAYYDSKVNDGMSRHDALVACLPWAFEEAAAGFYPAQHALDELGAAFRRSFEQTPTAARHTRRVRPGRDELWRAARWAATRAQQSDPDTRRARTNYTKQMEKAQ